MKTLGSILVALSSLGLSALLALDVNGVPSVRIGPLSFDLDLGVKSHVRSTWVRARSEGPVEARKAAERPIAPSSQDELDQGEELFGLSVLGSDEEESRRLKRFYRAILLPAGGSPELSHFELQGVSDAEILDRILDLETCLDDRLLALPRDRIS